jgi:hypothetical protein
MAYFEDGSKSMEALQTMVNDVGIANVLYALARISQVKAEHARDNNDDGFQWWEARANKIGALAAARFMHDA